MAIIIAGFAIAGVLCLLIALQNFGALGLGLITLVAGICFGAPFFQVASLTSERALVVALLGFYVFARDTRFFQRKPACWIDAVGLAFLLWVLGSALTHEWQLQEAQPLKSFLFYYALPGIVYWIARETPIDGEQSKKMLIGLCCFGVYLALTAVAEWRQFYGLVLPTYIASAEYPEFLGRGRGPLLNPSGNGILLCLSIGAAGLCWRQVGIRGKNLIAVAVPLLLLGVFATLTRCAWVGGILAVGCLVVTVIPSNYRGRVAMVALAALLCVLAVNRDRLNNFKRDKHVSAADMSKSAGLRPMLADVAWQIFRAHPVAGVGFGQYKEHARFYHDRETDAARPYIQHNVVLSVLTETGLIGMLLYVSLVGAWAFAAWQLWGHASTAFAYRGIAVLFATVLLGYLANGMFQDVTIVPMVHMVVAYFGGLTVGQYLLNAAPQSISHQPTRLALDRRMVAQ